MITKTEKKKIEKIKINSDDIGWCGEAKRYFLDYAGNESLVDKINEVIEFINELNRRGK